MMFNELISIIIPTYNRGNYISETLDSIISQTYSDWECIIVDDGSTDNTEEIVSHYVTADSRFQYHKRPDNYGAGGNGARNYGFTLSKGEFINWFDSDDVMLPNFLQKKIDLIKNTDFQFVITGGSFWDGEKIIRPMEVYDSTDFYFDIQKWNLQVGTPCVLFRRSFLDNKDLFSEQMFRAQETEFFSRIFYKIERDVYQIHNISLFLYRQHAGSITKKDEAYNTSFLLSWIKLHVDNIARAVDLKHKKLIIHHFGLLARRFFKALENNDVSTAKYIKSVGFNVLNKVNVRISYSFYLLCSISIITKKSHYFTKRLMYRCKSLI